MTDHTFDVGDNEVIEYTLTLAKITDLDASSWRLEIHAEGTPLDRVEVIGALHMAAQTISHAIAST